MNAATTIGTEAAALHSDEIVATANMTETHPFDALKKSRCPPSL